MIKFWQQKIGYFLVGIVLFILLCNFQIVPTTQPSVAIPTIPTATQAPATPFPSMGSTSGEL